ncbi:MAG TPA: hypothetical protein VF070_06515 [Streptosporangiaceae bacterium]
MSTASGKDFMASVAAASPGHHRMLTRGLVDREDAAVPGAALTAAERAAGVEVTGRCSVLFGDRALIELPGEEEPVRWPVAEIAAATGLDAEELPGRELVMTVRETLEGGRVLSAFRLAE